jgi:superfamily II DNA or RNA helicase
MRDWGDCLDDVYNKRLSLLATMISRGILDIKIAFGKHNNLYHEKLGLITDSVGDTVAFSGSANESVGGLQHNYEVVDVFCSWQASDSDRVKSKMQAFDQLWSGFDDGVDVIDFPQVALDRLMSCKQDIDLDELQAMDMDETGRSSLPSLDLSQNAFRVPQSVRLYDYQLQAIQTWMEQGSMGIFDMATGAGKTYTALGALARLSQSLQDKLFVVIVCPYQHLVEQWVEDILAFGVKPIICYSKYNWEDKLAKGVDGFNLGVYSSVCTVACNASYSTPKMQRLLSKIRGNSVIVVDEAHNFGSPQLQKVLPEHFVYRLALSATLDRHHDESGTASLYKYFGTKCIYFGLKDAIDNGFLTPYKYYPIVVKLDCDELQQYVELTNKIIQILVRNGKDNQLPQSAELLLIKRSRLVARAGDKVQALRQAIIPYKDKRNILVYCGATRVSNMVTDTADTQDVEDKRQIEVVTTMLGKDLGMKVSMFTSHEDARERTVLKEKFGDGRLQALVAIKCLDEGVNIPSISTAFILASSTNPKEYIQRRGRVLRKSLDKYQAEIYDFVVMPRDIYGDTMPLSSNINVELSLIKRELERVRDFVKLCSNPSDSYQLQQDIDNYYRLNYRGGVDCGI